MKKFALILAFCITFVYGMYFKEAITLYRQDQAAYSADLKEWQVSQKEEKICVDREQLLLAIAILEDTGNNFIAEPLKNAFNEEVIYDYQKAHEAK